MVSGDPKPRSCYKGAICVAVNTSAERIFIATNIKLTLATNVASNTKVTTIDTRITRERILSIYLFIKLPDETKC